MNKNHSTINAINYVFKGIKDTEKKNVFNLIGLKKKNWKKLKNCMYIFPV